MSLAGALGRYMYRIDSERMSPCLTSHAKTLLIDAIACMLGGVSTEIVQIADRQAGGSDEQALRATSLVDGRKVAVDVAVLANCAAVRSLDFMDVYAEADVSHPSEAVPVAIACAEAGGATGREFLSGLIAAFGMHAWLARQLSLHDNGLHHVGHAAWVAPLLAARLLGYGDETAARAVNLSAPAFIAPDGFSRGHLANVKALAYGLIASRGVNMTLMARDGLAAQDGACDEVVELLSRICGRAIDAGALVPSTGCDDVADIWLKTYPAQYALQPLIAAASAFHRRNARQLSEISQIVVRVSTRTAERTADPAKFRPRSREAADHSLPFAVAAGLLDGGLSASAMITGRWGDADIIDLAGSVIVEARDGESGFAIGKQEIELRFKDGSTELLDCIYPPRESSWREIAVSKLEQFSGGDPRQVVEAVDRLETLTSIAPLVDAIVEAGATPKRPVTALQSAANRT